MARVVVAVLGDVGRSPRMQYHANSFARMYPAVTRVTMLGYSGERCVPCFGDNKVIISECRFNAREFPQTKKLPIAHAGMELC